MNQGRLPGEVRDRTKKVASDVIRLFVALPKAREEVRVLGKQLLRSGTSVAAHIREASRARSDAEFCSKPEGAYRKPTSRIYASNCSATIVESAMKRLMRFYVKPEN